MWVGTAVPFRQYVRLTNHFLGPCTDEVDGPRLSFIEEKNEAFLACRPLSTYSFCYA